MRKEIGNRIKRIRESKNISPKKLADEIGILDTSLSKIEREGSNSVDRLFQIANALEVKVIDLFEDKPLNAKENKFDYGFVSKEEFSEVKNSLQLLIKEFGKLREEISKTRTLPKRKYAKPKK